MEGKLKQLELILEAGDNAKEAAIMYFATDLIGKAMLFIAIMTLVILFYRLFTSMVKKDRQLCELAVKLGTKSRGEFTDSERLITWNKLEALVDCYVEEKEKEKENPRSG
jgi:hypothetical protein